MLGLGFYLLFAGTCDVKQQYNNLFTNKINQVKFTDNNEIELTSYKYNWTYHQNLEKKTIHNNITETFGYDEFDRIVSVRNGIGPSNSISYDVTGGIKKQLMPNEDNSLEYTYDHKNSLLEEDPNSTNFAPQNAPVSVSMKSTDPAFFPKQKVHNLLYTPFNSVKEISNENNQINTQFYYGADEQRNKMVHTDNTTSNKSYTKYYCGNYEKTIYPDNSFKEVTYIGSQNGVVVAIVKNTNASGNKTENTYSILKDHLGSIMEIYELQPDGSTQNRGKFSYDIWGRLRNHQNYSDYGHVDIPAFEILSRGFTGHEHLTEWDLINMNGRIYDPTIGQFMQPDNFIQAPDDPLL